MEDRYQTKLRQGQITVYCLYGALTAINIAYLMSKIVKLTEKKFHLLMFCLIQLCCICYVIEAYSYPYINSWLPIVFSGLNLLFNELAHSIFVIKFWVVA